MLCNIPLAPRKYWRVSFQYSIVRIDIILYTGQHWPAFYCTELQWLAKWSICTLLHCTALYLIEQHYPVLYCTHLLHCNELHSKLWSSALHSTTQYCTTLQFTALQWTVQQYTTHNFTALYCIYIYSSALHWPSLCWPFTALHYLLLILDSINSCTWMHCAIFCCTVN